MPPQSQLRAKPAAYGYNPYPPQQQQHMGGHPNQYTQQNNIYDQNGGRSPAQNMNSGKNNKQQYDIQPGDIPKLDFASMDQQTLWKYKRAFKLRVKPNSTHEQLVEAVQKHYDQMEVNEKDAIVFFVYSVRNQGNILKLPPQDIVQSSRGRDMPRD